MMDISATTQLISTIGFPIAMCVYLLFYIKSFDEKYCEQLNNMAKAIENNTLAITKLMSIIDNLAKENIE
jgi:hypothetical protein